MHELMTELYPICRSITGNGVRKTDEIISRHIPLEMYEVKSGTKVFDWTVPKEWNINDAYVISPKGEKIIDFKKSNLHVLNYSIPINAKMSLDELKPHLYTMPEIPDVIPYRTSYYNENWGFCLSHKQFLELEPGEYQVFIDSSLTEGSLTYGEYYLKGKREDEVLISCYTCHPSLCNDNLSGVVLTTFLAKHLSKMELNYSYRFLFIPETIGAITWLSNNKSKISKIKHGLVATCLGDPGHSVYKKTLHGDDEIDQVVVNVLKNSGEPYKIIDFFPMGSDERQYCTPGIDLSMGSLMRSPYSFFKEYHTSVDNLDFVQGQYLANTFSKYLSVIYTLENNKKFLSLNPECEPQLGKRGLYTAISGQQYVFDIQNAMIAVLILSNGHRSLLDISERSNVKFDIVKQAADVLVKHNLLKEII